MKNGIFFLCIMLFCGIRSVSGQEVNSEKDVRADSIADDLGTTRPLLFIRIIIL